MFAQRDEMGMKFSGLVVNFSSLLLSLAIAHTCFWSTSPCNFDFAQMSLFALPNYLYKSSKNKSSTQLEVKP
jgi:hypothetical protein